MNALRLAPTIAGLALATEAAAGVPPETASRAAIVACALAERLGMGVSERRQVYYASLLRYSGCTGFAHETAWYSGGDDIGLLRALSPADHGKPGSVLAHVSRGAGSTRERVTSLARIAADPALGRKLARAHCEQAAALSRALELGEELPRLLAQSHERFDGSGAPLGLRAEQIAAGTRVLQVAYGAVLHATFSGFHSALDTLRERRGTEFDPAVVDSFTGCARELLGAVNSHSVWELVLTCEPLPQLHVSDPPRLATAFAQFVDLKSPFMLGHSTGVAELVDRALTRAQASPEERASARLAALLHDLGRTSVPNGIWDKPAALSPIERARAREHALQSRRILERSELAPEVAPIVGAHHERLDGSGYPRSLRADGLSRAARVLAAADVFQALNEERAYRRAYDRAEATRLLESEAVAGRLDRDAVSWVLAAAGMELRRAAPPDGLSEREVAVLIELARGLTNKKIAQRLQIAPRAVGQHVARLYEKTGIDTRAAAALFAVSHDLVGRHSSAG